MHQVTPKLHGAPLLPPSRPLGVPIAPPLYMVRPSTRHSHPNPCPIQPGLTHSMASSTILAAGTAWSQFSVRIRGRWSCGGPTRKVRSKLDRGVELWCLVALETDHNRECSDESCWNGGWRDSGETATGGAVVLNDGRSNRHNRVHSSSGWLYDAYLTL